MDFTVYLDAGVVIPTVRSFPGGLIPFWIFQAKEFVLLVAILEKSIPIIRMEFHRDTVGATL